METTPQNSHVQPPIEASAQTKKTTSKTHYPRRDFYFSLFYPDVDQTFQAIDPHSNKDFKQVDFLSDYDDDKDDEEISRREILDPDREEDEIMDPEKDHRQREFPNQHDDEDINPTRDVPEEDNDLTADDGAIFDEPIREIEEPYRRGYADEQNVPPIEEEFPKEELKQNISNF